MAGDVEAGREEGTVQRYHLVLAAFSFLLLTAAVITVYDHPMTGYELSVYQSTPLLFWIAIIFCQLTGILLFYKYYGTGTRLWGLGLFEILLSNFVLLTLYLYKGFIYIERTDSMSYVGYAKDIVLGGHFHGSNFYPIASILMAETGNITGQGMIMMSQIFPAIFFSAYTIGILCWSKAISPQPRFITSMMLASMPIFFAWFIPTLFNQTLCVLMLPLFFYILWRGGTGSPRFKLLAALMIVFFIVGHPMVAMAVLLFLGVMAVSERMTGKVPRTISVYIVLFGFVLLFGWIVYHALLVSDLRMIIEQLLGLTEGVSTFGNAAGQMSQMGILSTVQSVLVCIIDDLIFALLAFFGGFYILRRWRVHPMTTIYAMFIIGGAALIAIVFFTYAHNPFRLINLNYVMILTIPLVGYMLYFARYQGKKLKARVIAALIVFCLVSTVYTVYQDPNSLFPNGSVTRAEIAGTDFLVHERADDMSIFTIQTKPWRYTDLMYGAVYKRENPDINYNERPTTAHFNSFLTTNNTMGTAYLVISDYEYVAYTQTWSAVGKFTAEDFTALAYSGTAGHIYTNNEMNLFARE
ncbi:MAG: hypothetical protein ISF22_05980 [Methanomassiliicoccus sp.]|nr:hypothetical protein [Methanomassiliicoccus sp.]